MVNDLLDCGRIGTRKLRLALRPVKLSALASMAVEAARPAAEALFAGAQAAQTFGG